MSRDIYGLGPLRRYERQAPAQLDALEVERRELALTIVCPVPRCRAPIGELCTNLVTRTPLTTQAAHVARLKAAGHPLPPVTRAEVSGWPTRRTEASREALTRETRTRQRGYP